jgi:hypothetical protein
MLHRPALSTQEISELVAEALPCRGRENLDASPADGVPVLLEARESCEDRAHMQGDRLDREGVILALDAPAPKNEQAKVLGVSRPSGNRLCANDALARGKVEIHAWTRSQPLRALQRQHVGWIRDDFGGPQS